MLTHLFFLTLFFGLGTARRYDVDSIDQVELEVDGEVSLAVTSKPMTGYAWFLEAADSPYLEILSIRTGDYEKGQSDAVGGSIATQVFRLGCTSSCFEGAKADVLLTYQRPWDKSPSASKKIKVNIIASQEVIVEMAVQ
jgi:predicted secreted protein